MLIETSARLPVHSVSVEEIGERREKRAAEQAEMLKKHPDCVLVCIGMNIAGPVKRSGLIDHAFFSGAAKTINAIAGSEIPFRDGLLFEGAAGIEAMFAVRGSAETVKSICVGVEEDGPEGRLLDIDVIGQDGIKQGRNAPRKCLICGETASVCARSRAHSVPELQKKTAVLLNGGIAERAGRLAYEALIKEVSATPKPGLVDRINNGANPDMDFDMFIRSAEALRPFFTEMALAVLESGEGDCPLVVDEAFFGEELAGRLRSIGIEAERAMLEATGGANTHRGAIWSIGLLTCAYAYLAAVTREGETEAACADKALLTAAAARFARLLGDGALADSKGSAVRRKYGIGGPVEEALAGFPHALTAIQKHDEYFDHAVKSGVMMNPWAYALLAIMAELDDNNALRRGGEEGARFVKSRAGELLEFGMTAPYRPFIDAVIGFDRELIERNISCGGAADMLAAAIFICRASADWHEEIENLRGTEERFVRALCAELHNE